MHTMTGNTKAWLVNPEAVRRMQTPNFDFTDLTLCDLDMATEGWIFAGECLVTLKLVNPVLVLQQAIENYDKAIQKTRADAEIKARFLEEKKQELLAITYEG